VPHDSFIYQLSNVEKPIENRIFVFRLIKLIDIGRYVQAQGVKEETG
jgi:hypothetical protein